MLSMLPTAILARPSWKSGCGGRILWTRLPAHCTPLFIILRRPSSDSQDLDVVQSPEYRPGLGHHLVLWS
jgi:hypothetical protein